LAGNDNNSDFSHIIYDASTRFYGAFETRYLNK
jgi:hypothetical protein